MGLVEDAQALRAKIDAAQTAARVTIDDQLADLPDDTYTDVVALFPDWVSGETVAVGAVRQFDGALYRCVQAHTTQADWTPPAVPALWTPVRQTQGPTVDPWVQPTGSQDAYQVGDRVTFEGQTYESTAANNVWSPGVFGWTVV
jgi:hypothetical protein